MVSTRQLVANRANALKSTGPKTAAGKARAAANALASGLYAKLVVLPSLGETPDGFLAFQRAVAKSLGARGTAERALAARVAAILWRQQRVMVAETAAIARAAGPLPPDPAGVAMSGIHYIREVPPSAPTCSRLSEARTWAHARRTCLAEVEAAIVAIAPPAPSDKVVGGVAVKTILDAAADVLAWQGVRGDELGPWNPILASLGAPADRSLWTLGLVRAVVDAAAAQTSRDADTLWTDTAERLAAAVVDYRKKLAAWEADEAKYVAMMEADRQQVTAAPLVAEAAQRDAIARQEAHLGRELARALAAFEQVRALRPQGVAPLGFVLQPHAGMIGGGNDHRELSAGVAG